MLIVNNRLVDFKIGFAEPDGTVEKIITFDNIAKAIAKYQRSQVCIDPPWKAYVQGLSTHT